MIKHNEIKTYEYYDIKITVEIDYDENEISILDRNHHGACSSKHFVFAGRGLEYMNGWRNVLSGIEYAIDKAEEELSSYIKEKEKEKHDLVTDVLMQATDLVNQKRYGNKKKTKKT